MVAGIVFFAFGLEEALHDALILYEVLRHREDRAAIRARRGAATAQDLSHTEPG